MSRALSADDVAAFRTRLCAVAERLFAEHGVEQVGIRQIAQALGCSPMTPYRYFRDKDEILAATRAAAFDRFAASLEAAAGAEGAQDKARAVGQAYVAFALAEPNAYRLMFDLAQPGEERFPELARAGARARRTMTDYIETLVAAGLLEGDPALLGHAFWAATHGVVSLQLAGKLGTPDFATLHHEVMRLLIRGAAPGRSPGSSRA